MNEIPPASSASHPTRQATRLVCTCSGKSTPPLEDCPTHKGQVVKQLQMVRGERPVSTREDKECFSREFAQLIVSVAGLMNQTNEEYWETKEWKTKIIYETLMDFFYPITGWSPVPEV